MKHGLAGCHAWNQLGTPDATSRTRNANLLREARVHVHDVRHEGEGGELVGESAAEEPEVIKGRESGAEVILENGGGYKFLLYGGEGLEFDRVLVINILLWIVSVCSCRQVVGVRASWYVQAVMHGVSQC